MRDPSRTVRALFDAPAGPLLVYGTVMPWHADYRVVRVSAESVMCDLDAAAARVRWAIDDARR